MVKDLKDFYTYYYHMTRPKKQYSQDFYFDTIKILMPDPETYLTIILNK
jgi:hypothetical protein